MRKNKFKVGQLVRCYRPPGPTLSDFDFIGTVISVADAGDEEAPAWEYAVTNAPTIPGGGVPVLIWEHEMEAQ